MLALDAWLEKIKRCEHLGEEELKALCEYVKEILVEESNVQPVNAPVTVRPADSRQDFVCSEIQERRGQSGPSLSLSQ